MNDGIIVTFADYYRQQPTYGYKYHHSNFVKHVTVCFNHADHCFSCFIVVLIRTLLP